MRLFLVLLLAIFATGCDNSASDKFGFLVGQVSEPDAPSVLTPDKHQPVIDATVKIICNNTRGSGVNTKHGILTCAHCVQAGHKIYVFCGEEKAEAAILKIDPIVDLALLHVKWSLPHKIADVSDANPSPGDTLISSGRGVDGTVSINTHVAAESSISREMRVKIPFNHGRSGSALVDGTGKIVGIASKMDMTTEPYSGIAVSAAAVRGFLPAESSAAIPLPKESKSKRRVVIASAEWCGPCVAFHSINKNGNDAVEFVYIDVDKPKPPTVNQEEWDRAIATVNGLYGPDVERGMPLALWRTPKGKWYSKSVGGMRTVDVQKWVQ